jgi:hypothetical protein
MKRNKSTFALIGTALLVILSMTAFGTTATVFGGGTFTPTPQGMLGFSDYVATQPAVNAEPAATPDADHMVQAGGESFAGVVRLVSEEQKNQIFRDNDAYVLEQATNLQNCVPGFQFGILVSNSSPDFRAQFPHCGTMNLLGQQTQVRLTLAMGDPAAYNTMAGGTDHELTIFVIGNGSDMTVNNGAAQTMNGSPLPVSFGRGESVVLNLNLRGFVMVRFVDSTLNAVSPVVQPVNASQPNGQLRLVEAGLAQANQHNYCAWAARFQVRSADQGVLFTFDDCWEMIIVGQGQVTIRFTADSEGYNTSAGGPNGQLAFWPMGTGAIIVTRGTVSSEPFTPENGSEGISLVRNTFVDVTFTLQPGQIIVMPLGQWRSNIAPQY